MTPAVRWLERDYNQRSGPDWGVPPRLPSNGVEDWSYTPPVYRKGLFQLLDSEELCGATNPESELTDCYCYSTPAQVCGMEWTAEDDERWLKYEDYRGDEEAWYAYMRKAHSYMYDAHKVDEGLGPNNLTFWEETNV